jgi:uncharacterized membrane-anchored protein
MTLPARRRLGDRRGRRRYEIVGQLWGALESVEPLRLRNLARGGALLESRFSLQVDSVHRLRLASADRTSDLQARVRHVSRPVAAAGGSSYLIGMEFLALPPLASEHLEQLLAANVQVVDVAVEGVHP